MKPRLLRHLSLAALTAAFAIAGWAVLEDKRLVPRISTGLAFASLFWLACTLCVGPWQVLRGVAHPLSSYLRRDLAIWAGVAGLLHTAVGFHVHAGGNYRYYFVPRVDRPGALPFRTDLGGLANFSGAAASLILLLLLVLSSDRALRRLGPQRWKGLQRWTYALALLTVVHGAAYQISGKRDAPLVVLFVALAAAPAALQWLGFRRMRQARPPAKGATDLSSS